MCQWPSSSRTKCAVLLCAALGAAVPMVASAQTVNPATQQPPEAQDQKPDERPHTWNMPPIEVYGKAPLRDDDRIGEYAQPRWTADRLLGETRVYVIPKGKVEFEYWMVPETPRDGFTDYASSYEVEFGLPHRFQLDLYAVSHKEGVSGPMSFSEQKVELRYAFADWGKIWGNPTIYVEWKGLDAAPDHFEGKLLLGGEIRSGWHWGSNFVWEHEVAGAQENSNEWTVGISHTVVDSKFALGVETQLALVNELDGFGGRTPLERQFFIGPSMQIRPLPQMHLDFAPLFGTTEPASRAKVIVVLGYEF
jgi:hypothetical protein